MGNHIIFDICGWVGAACILLGFYRTSIGKWTGKSLWFEIDNLAGSALLIVYAVSRHAPVSIFMNTIWVIVAFRGITSIGQRRGWSKVGEKLGLRPARSRQKSKKTK